ncbi:hypothetical protein MMC20_004443 [Loxospora ochrophaea]|nr:hypothetical protein [Loxospora ochrophaea]
MSSSFEADVKAYYEAKKPYTDLLKKAVSREKTQDSDKPEEPLTQDMNSRQWSTDDAPDLSMPAGPPIDYQALLKGLSGLKIADQKGKSTGKK